MQYTIQSGDNLSTIAANNGLTVQQIVQANPNITNPSLIRAGATLTIPDKTATPAQGIQNSLPAASTTAPVTNPQNPDVFSKYLPAESLDNLTKLKFVLNDIANKGKSTGVTAGISTVLNSLSSMGITPSNTSGNILSGIASMVGSNVVNPVTDIYNKSIEAVNAIQTQQEKVKSDAQTQINQAISSGMWNNFSASQRQALWSSAGYTGTATTVPTASAIEFYHTTDSSGSDWLIGYNKNTGAIISKEQTTSGSGADLLSAAQTELDNYINSSGNAGKSYNDLVTRYPQLVGQLKISSSALSSGTY